MKSRITGVKGIVYDEVRVRQHRRLQAMEVTLVPKFFGQLGTDSHNLHPAPIEISAQFFQPP